jgi:hypothetical protein
VEQVTELDVDLFLRISCCMYVRADLSYKRLKNSFHADCRNIVMAALYFLKSRAPPAKAS